MYVLPLWRQSALLNIALYPAVLPILTEGTSSRVDPSAISSCFDYGKYQMRSWKTSSAHKGQRGFLTHLKASLLR